MSNTEMKIGSNRDINKDRKNYQMCPKKIVAPAVQHDPVETTILHNVKMLTEKHNEEKLVITLLIVGLG